MRMPDFIEDHPVISSILGIIIAIVIIVKIIKFIGKKIEEGEQWERNKKREEEENKRAEAQKLIMEERKKEIEDNLKKTKAYLEKNCKEIRSIFLGKKIKVMNGGYQFEGFKPIYCTEYDSFGELLLDNGLTVWYGRKNEHRGEYRSDDDKRGLDYILIIDKDSESNDPAVYKVELILESYKDREFLGKTTFHQVPNSKISVEALEWLVMCIKRHNERDRVV